MIEKSFDLFYKYDLGLFSSSISPVVQIPADRFFFVQTRESYTFITIPVIVLILLHVYSCNEIVYFRQNIILNTYPASNIKPVQIETTQWPRSSLCKCLTTIFAFNLFTQTCWLWKRYIPNPSTRFGPMFSTISMPCL